MRSLLNNTRRSVVGTALVALLVLSITAATASAALPEFKTEKFPVKFTISGASVLVETETRAQVECREIAGSGEITGPKAGTATLKFPNCVLPYMCTGNLKEVKMEELELFPAYILSKTQVALELKPKVGTRFAALKCNLSAINNGELRGSILGKLTPFNQYTTTLTDKIFKSSTPGFQELQHYEVGSELVPSWLEFRHELEGPFEHVSWNVELALHLEKSVRVES